MRATKNISEVSPLGRFFIALLVFLVGGLLVGIAFGWVEVDPSTIHAPLWVLAAAGMVFILSGMLVLLAESERLAWLRNLVIWLFVVCLAVPFNWVAFGAGERHFRGTSLFMGSVSSSAQTDVEGRIVFGIVAVVIDLVVVLVPLRFLFKKRKEE